MAEDNTVYIERPNDHRDYIERAQSRSIDYDGKELTPDEMAQRFSLLDKGQRVDVLQSLASDKGELKLSEAGRRWEFESALRNRHELLRKVGR